MCGEIQEGRGSGMQPHRFFKAIPGVERGSVGIFVLSPLQLDLSSGRVSFVAPNTWRSTRHKTERGPEPDGAMMKK